jgi:hypothetical protein
MLVAGLAEAIERDEGGLREERVVPRLRPRPEPIRLGS